MLRRNDATADANGKLPSSQSPCITKDTLQLTTIDLDAFDSFMVDSISTDGPTLTYPSDDTEKYCGDTVTAKPEQ